MYFSKTDGIEVRVESFFLNEQSDPERNLYIWAYHIRITNNTPGSVQLISRTWTITDANGLIREMNGKGVVGEQPVLEPGETFAYTSGTPLNTPSGIMCGLYHMVRGNNEFLDVKIPAF